MKKKVCNHPFLIQEFYDEYSKESATDEEHHRNLVDTSGKMLLLEKLLCKTRQEGKKVLIFSQFIWMLKFMEELCELLGMGYLTIMGDT